MPAHMNDTPPQSPWLVLFENGCRFSLVAMVTGLGLWLVKHGNKRNSKTNFRSTFKIGWYIRTMRTKQWSWIFDEVAMVTRKRPIKEFYDVIQNLKKKSKKALHGFVDIGLLHMSTQNHVNRIYRFWVTSVPVTQVCDFPHFEISAKTFQKYLAIVYCYHEFKLRFLKKQIFFFI